MQQQPFWREQAAHAITTRSAYQHPDELGTLLAILDDTYRPDLVVEVGGGRGGSAWAWAQLPSVTEVITVTLPDPARSWLCCPMRAKHTVIYGDSTHGDTMHQLVDRLDGRRPGFVFIDGDHAYKTVAQDFALYGPLVADNGLIGLHDILPETRWVGFEVDRLWAEIPVNRKVTELIGDANGGMGTGLVLPAIHRGSDTP